MPQYAARLRPVAALVLGALIAAAPGTAGAAHARFAPPQTSIVAFLYVFHGPDGANPTGRLVADAAGALYGTTVEGGAYGFGVVYKLTPGSNGYTEQVLHSFAGPPADGANPEGGVVVDQGRVFGTTLAGGPGACGGSPAGCGVVFRLKPMQDGGYDETILHAFAGGRADGAVPGGQIVLRPGGLLYGATGFGGTHDKGTVFRLAAQGDGYDLNILHSFGSRHDGAGPYGLIVAASGALFGVTGSGGTYRQGTAFMLQPSGPRYQEHVLHSFGGPSDGARPTGQLAIDESGALYGTTSYGRSGVSTCCGTAFKLIPSGSTYVERVLFNFQRASEGINPSPVIVKPGGVLYGTTLDGGGQRTRGRGTIFELMPVQGHYTELVLHDFGGGRNGAYPSGALLPDRSGALFGVTANGGGSSRTCERGCGLVYNLTH